MKAYDKLFINGDWVTPSGKGSIDVINSTTEASPTTPSTASPARCGRAIRRARSVWPVSYVPVRST